MVLSGTALSVLLMQTESKLSFAITGVLALGVMLFFVFRTKLLATLFCGRTTYVCVIAGVVACLEVYYAKSTFYTCCWRWMEKLFALLRLPGQGLLLRLAPWVVALLALPAIFGFLLWFVDFIREQAVDFWEKTDFYEQMFLLCAGVLFAVIIVFGYTCTEAFYGAHINGSYYNFDLVYSADSGYLVNQDVFRNIGAEQNDLRQPLYGVFAMPFATVAWLISRPLFFVPNSYILVLQVLEMLLFLVAVVLISRMMKLQSVEKCLFLVLLSVTYPVLIFSLTAEQYLLAVFYLILMIYLQEEKTRGGICYIGATGSMLTTGIFFPLITWDWNFGKFVKNTLKLCGMFFAVMILSGRLTTFLDVGTYIEGYAPYAGGDVDFLDKLRQYVNFVGCSFLAPASRVDFETYRHVSWQMVPVTGWRFAGILVMICAVLGVIVSRKDRFSRICGAWMAFSLLLLGIVGWGTIDNGLMLYTLYFGWAFVAMCFRLVEHVLREHRIGKIAVLSGIIAVTVVWNITALKQVLVFATQFFPALR